ncbi:MAG: phosphate--acyl-ACP acyltransferase, partial [Ilumatobacteraceae bacterium]
MLPIAVDALGGDKAPDEIIAGAREAVAAGIDVILVGPRGLAGCEGFEFIEASEVILMHEDA